MGIRDFFKVSRAAPLSAPSPPPAGLEAPEEHLQAGSGPSPTTGTPGYTAALQSVLAELLRAPDKQLSTDPNNFQSILAYFEDTLDGYPDDTRPRIIKVLRALAESDDDVSGSLGDLRSMCGAGFTVDYEGGARAIKAAEAEIERLHSALFPEGGGLSGLITNQVGEFVLAGASSLEWVPLKNRKGIDRVAVVPAEEMRIRRDPSTQALVHQQLGLGGTVTLSPVTYQYKALLTSGRRPYGVPLFVAALGALERKRQLLIAEQRVVNLMARSALITAEIEQPTAEQLGLGRNVQPADPRYQDALRGFFQQVARLIMSGSENGLYVAPGKTKIVATPLNQSASGAPEVTKGNQHRVWNGLRTQPFLRGEMDSTTQALAQVTVPLVYAQAVMIQTGLKQVLEFGLNLHLRLAGIPVQVTVNFNPPKSPFLLAESEALLNKAKAHAMLASLFGPAWAQAAMREFDIVEGDAARAPSWWQPAAAPADTGAANASAKDQNA